MKRDQVHLLHVMRMQKTVEVDRQLLRVLEQEEQVHFLGSKDSGGTVLSVLRIWTPREAINRGTDHPLLGAQALLRKLDTMPHQRKVRQVGFSSSTHTCMLFFDWTRDTFLGYTMIRKRPEEEERERRARFDRFMAAEPEQTSASRVA